MYTASRAVRTPKVTQAPQRPHLTDEVMARTLERRTRRVAMAPWLYHVGLLEFSRYAHKSKGRKVTAIFDLLRLRDLVLIVGAYSLVPSELLGVVGYVTDAFAIQRLSKYIPAAEIAQDRAIGGFPMTAGWALEFNSPRARWPLAALVPAIFHASFAVKNKLPSSTSAIVVFRESLSGGAFITVLSEFSRILQAAITQEVVAMEGARRSSEIAAERHSKARLWLVGTHTRLTALATARWAAQSSRAEPGPAKFIELTAAEEARLREMFERRTIPLKRITERITAIRSARDLPTTVAANVDLDLDVVIVSESAEAVVEWLAEAVCPFAQGPLLVDLQVSPSEVSVSLEADRFPGEVMHPFVVRDVGQRQRMAGTLQLG
jgi:hypothetical protein